MKRVGDLLSDFFKEYFDEDSLKNGRLTAGLYNSWALAAKAANISAAADHSRIREFEHKVLVVEAEHPGWVQLLQTKQRQLLNYVQLKFPELDIQGISFCLSREQISPVSTTSVVNVPESISETEEVIPKNDDLHEPIKELRKVIQKRNRN